MLPCFDIGSALCHLFPVMPFAERPLGRATGTDALGAVPNLALPAHGARLRSWGTCAATVPGHEPFRANDGSMRTFWLARAENFPADLGIEWPSHQEISCLIVRHLSKSLLPTAWASRTQPLARLQWWEGGKWVDLDAQIIGRSSTVIRYVFEPVRTQRIRLLYTEPPVLVNGVVPDQAGVYISELEAYTCPPFQAIKNRPGLVHSSHFIIEPKQTRVFSDRIAPTLIVAESSWAKEPCSATVGNEGRVTLRNGFLQLDLLTAPALREVSLTNRVTGEGASTPDSEAFMIRTSEGNLRASDFQAKRVAMEGSKPEVALVRVDLLSPGWEVSVFYELRGQDHFYHKWLTLSPRRQAGVQVLDVTVSSLGFPTPLDLGAGENQELSYPITSLDRGGFFSCLETIFWDHAGDALTYYPGAVLKAGDCFTSDKAVVGIFQKRGEYWLGLDRGIREWVIEYHARVSPIPKCWPDVYCEGWSAKVGLGELKARPEWMERWMRMAGRFGIRYMDGFEPMHKAMTAPTEEVKRWVELATESQIDTGWWIDHRVPGGGSSPLGPVFGCRLAPQAEEHLHDVVRFVKDYGLRAMHWGDFMLLQPCDESGHGHLPGKYSLYAQGQRILRFGEELRATDPRVTLGGDMGWFNPQFTRFLDGRGHIDNYDHMPTAEPDIHLDRLYADMNRRYMHIEHGVYLHPWYRNLNCVAHYGHETHNHDRAGFRYSLLSALGVAAQVVFNDAPPNAPDSEIEFSQRWLNWAKANKEYLKQGDILFDRSSRYVNDVWQGDADSLFGFAHIRGDRGFIFLINPTVQEQIAELTLALDAPHSQLFRLEEEYPGGMSLRGPAKGLYPQGGLLRATVPAKQVRILWIAPSGASKKRERRFQPENIRTPDFRRYLGEWAVSDQEAATITVRSGFSFPNNQAALLKTSAPEADWKKEPWAFDKAYLVLLLSDESKDLVNHWVPDNLFISETKDTPAAARAWINGSPKELIPLKTVRNQPEALTRCYFISLSEETKPGAANDVEIKLPTRADLVFSGAYLDLPDQMPTGEE